MAGNMAAALAAFRADGPRDWTALPFFGPEADAVAEAVDARHRAGARVLPAFDDAFAAFRLVTLAQVRVVIVGQDPYPTPGDAHGLAFSYRGRRALPRSLRAILAEALGDADPASGDLTGWARQGVLLLNTALTVEAGAAGAHLGLGWDALARQAVAAVSARAGPTAFMLWGGKARELAPLVDASRHLVLECGHPSPLNRRRDFRGCGHFQTANSWLLARWRGVVHWSLLGADPPARPEEAQGRLAL